MKKVKFDNSHIAEDILNKRKELESKPLTLDEIAENVASEYLVKKKKKALLPRSQEQWDELLKKVIAKTSLSTPEQDEAFLENIPNMHRCWTAIKIVGGSKNQARMYALVMTKIYKDESFPFEIEKIILALEEEELIWQLTKFNYKWSHRAERIMSCLHPLAYKKVFAEDRQTMAIIAM